MGVGGGVAAYFAEMEEEIGAQELFFPFYWQLLRRFL